MSETREQLRIDWLEDELQAERDHADRLAEALAELVLSGQHEGACDSIDPYDSCMLHLTTHERRAEAAREVLQAHAERRKASESA